MLFNEIVCSFRMSTGLKEKLEVRRKSLEMNPSEYIRHCIRKELGEI